MAFDDEPHKISYGRDEDQVTEKPKKTFLSRFSLSQKRIAGVILTLFLVSGVVIFSFTRNQNSQDEIVQVGDDISINGTVACSEDASTTEDECELEIITEDEKTYALDEKIDDESIKETLKPGQTVKVIGTVKTLGGTLGTQKKDVIQVSEVYLSAPKTPTPTNRPPSGPTPTVTDEVLPTPTPTPQELKNNTPDPGVTYQSASYVIDNKETLNGKNIYVFAHLVGGYVGIEGCTREPECDKSHFLLNDNDTPQRDPDYDLLLIGGTDDQEGDYASGQDFYTQGIVILDGENLYLEKIE